jgi:Domain of unknown function (DUF4185)
MVSSEVSCLVVLLTCIAVLYFLLNHRPDGTDNLKGAGVATISLSNSYPPKPNITRLAEYWWDGEAEPWYGDVGAVRHNGYIYAYGHAKDTPFVYLARVKWEEATKMECYEYWNGETWQTERLKTKDLCEKESVFWQINQGASSSYIVVRALDRLSKCKLTNSDNWMNSKVLAKTAPAPEGPWSEPITLYQAKPLTKGSSIYAAVPHPYYDTTGKTLVVTFTNHPNTIQAIRVVSWTLPLHTVINNSRFLNKACLVAFRPDPSNFSEGGKLRCTFCAFPFACRASQE